MSQVKVIELGPIAGRLTVLVETLVDELPLIVQVVPAGIAETPW